jgi:hypothetical protein
LGKDQTVVEVEYAYLEKRILAGLGLSLEDTHKPSLCPTCNGKDYVMTCHLDDPDGRGGLVACPTCQQRRNKDQTVVEVASPHTNKSGDSFPYNISMIQKVLPTIMSHDVLRGVNKILGGISKEGVYSMGVLRPNPRDYLGQPAPSERTYNNAARAAAVVAREKELRERSNKVDVFQAETLKKQIALHKEELETERVAAAAKLYSPRHCRKCGSSLGCMCPRTDEEPKKVPCRHVTLVRVTHHVAMEFGIAQPLLTNRAVYVCLNCRRIVARLPVDIPCFCDPEEPEGQPK